MTYLRKRLLADLFFQKQKAAAVAMNDAKSRYNCIFHLIVILVLMSFGLPQRVACVLIETLQKAVHHINVGFGRSSSMYGNKPVPILGIGQGNRRSLALNFCL